MNTVLDSSAPYRLCRTVVIALAVVTGALIPLLGDLETRAKAILAVGCVGLGAYVVINNRRIALVCAWVLIFPLSLEKIFPVLSPTFPGFLISPIVVSGADLVLLLLILTMATEAAVSRRRVFLWPGAATPYALLVGWVCILLFAKAPTSEGVLQVLHWCKMLIFLVTMSSAIRTREELMMVLVALAAAVMIQSVVLGISYGLKRPIGFSSKVNNASLLSIPVEKSSLTRATGTVGHSNQQATFQTLFTVPLVALFMVRNWIWRLVMAVVLVASFGAIILTFTRSSWLSCALVTCMIVGLAWRRGRISQAGWIGLCMGALAAVAIIACFSGPIVTRLTKADDGASISRVHLAMLAIQHIAHNPVAGVGPGNFINAKLAASDPVQWAGSVWLPRGYSYEPRFIGDMELDEIYLDNRWYYSSLPAHNKYLLVAAETGLVGLCLFLWFEWRLFSSLLSALREGDQGLWWVGVVLLGAFAVSLLNFALDLFNDDKTVLMPIFINVLMISYSRIAQRGNGLSPPIRP